MTQSFWTWLVFAILGLITLSFLPKTASYWVMAILVLGGVHVVSKNGSLTNFMNTLQTNTAGGNAQ